MIRPLAAVCLASVWLSAAHAEPGPSAGARVRATALFQEGRGLMAAGRIEEACPKLAESQRLDPSGGTLLNLALCDERAGQLVRSLSEFKEAAAVARREGRADREEEAMTRARAIALHLAPAQSAALVVAAPPPAARSPRRWLALAIGGAGVVGVALLLLLRVRIGDRRRF